MNYGLNTAVFMWLLHFPFFQYTLVSPKQPYFNREYVMLAYLFPVMASLGLYPANLLDLTCSFRGKHEACFLNFPRTGHGLTLGSLCSLSFFKETISTQGLIVWARPFSLLNVWCQEEEDTPPPSEGVDSSPDPQAGACLGAGACRLRPAPEA